MFVAFILFFAYTHSVHGVHDVQMNNFLSLSRSTSTPSGPSPIPPLSAVDVSTPIHLSISAFQDGERCAKTISNALKKATNPKRVSFGIVQARMSDEVDCVGNFRDTLLPELCKQIAGNFDNRESCADFVLNSLKHKVIDPSLAEGPSHQRSMSRELIDFNRSDRFCMQIDSHMDFAKNWDVFLTDDWVSTENEFAVLSAYVMDIGEMDRAMAYFVDCCGYSLEEGIPRGNVCGAHQRVDGMTPFLSTLWAAGFSFHRCHAERNVPIDPNLEWIFTGEEVSRAVRLFTHGYDVYVPTRNVVLHNYSHATQHFWQAGDQASISKKKDASQEKVRSLLGLEKDNSAGRYYNLGKQRTLEQWYSWGRPLERKSCKQDPLPRAPVADSVALIESAKP